MTITSRHIYPLLFFLVLSMLGACAVNPVTGEKELSLVSEKQEISIGQENYQPALQSQGGEYNVDEELTQYVNSVGQALAKVSDRPDLPYEFVVLNNGVPNAWALPGGKIAINRGLLLELDNEAELAAVLGHEIVHAAARHGAKGIERGMLLNVGLLGVGIAASNQNNSDLILGAAGVGAALINKKYGREAELESDRYGMEYMVRAGYNPQAAVTLQETFVRLSKDRKSNWLDGLFASHPPSQERVEANREYAQQLGTTGELGKAQYQAKIAHLKKTKPAYDAYEEGQQALKAKKPDEALRLADRAIDIEPRESLFYSLKGEAWKAKGNPRKAEESFSKALQYNPQHFLPHLQRGLARLELNNNSGARQDLVASNELLPTAPAYLGLGILAEQTGDRQMAVNHYQQAAGSQSSVGKQAASKLARLELPQNPGKYLNVKAKVNQRGTVTLTIHNQSAVTVGNIRVRNVFLDAAGNIVEDKSLQIRGPIGAGKSIDADTGLSLPSSNASFRAEITYADIIQ